MRRFFAGVVSMATLALFAPAPARADGAPDAAALLRVLGPRAESVFAPRTHSITALVSLPSGTSAASIGAVEVAPGIGRLQGGASSLLSWSSAHPGVRMEIATPLKPLLDKAAQWTHGTVARETFGTYGDGVVVGVADTGLDVTHPDFIDASGHSRVAWLLDLSVKATGQYPALESQFGVVDATGTLYGRVMTGADIDAARAAGQTLPIDEVGHGTHVTGIAAANGRASSVIGTKYVGMAPNATLVIARISDPGSESFDEGALLSGVAFIYDRADTMGMPVVANLSLGSESGPHDGTMLWEQTLAGHIDPSNPANRGHALVVAAGNSGSIVDNPTHQSVHVSKGTTMKVPMTSLGATNGSIQTWVAMRGDSNISVGIEGPGGLSLSPIAPGADGSTSGASYTAGVANATTQGGDIPAGSRSAVAIVTGAFAGGEYDITLVGDGTADLFVEGTGDIATPGSVGFATGVREGTVNLPATEPMIISVGCTMDRYGWRSISGEGLGLGVPVLDAVGGLGIANESVDAQEREICYFSSAGPTVTGVPKPEIVAPGGMVVSSMSQQAAPGVETSIFTSECPPPLDGGVADERCFQVDTYHAVSAGTSMSSPMVAGAVALLLQRDPSLTEDTIEMLLQAGAHPIAMPDPDDIPPEDATLHNPAPFDDQVGAGELDAWGALDALDDYASGNAVLPAADQSWMTLSAEYYAADGSTPLYAIVELRGEPSGSTTLAPRADLFDPTRLQPYMKVGTATHVPPTLVRRGPGLWSMEVELGAGLGGSSVTLGVTFDGVDIVPAKTVPIATDVWTASYASSASGSCAVGHGSAPPHVALAALAAACLVRRRRAARVTAVRASRSTRVG
jgi:subtilisin family serine protease